MLQKPKTRRQMTTEKIMENVEFYSRPDGYDPKDDIQIIGEHLHNEYVSIMMQQ